jgi:glycosyltransferase involved in cell wall biosynthesis
MKNNVHIYPSTILFESRMFKIARTISNLNIYDNIIILGINNGALPETEIMEKNIVIKRLEIEELSWAKQGFLRKIINITNLSILTFKFLIKVRPEVVHAHNLASLPVSIIYKMFYKSKVVYDTHEIETERQGWSFSLRMISKLFELFFIRFVDITVVVNDAIADLYRKWYKVSVVSIYNAPEYLNLDLQNNYFREKYNIKDETKIFVYIGVLTENRGVIKYANFAKKTELDICFIFIGFGRNQHQIEELAKDSKKIFIHEAVKQNVLRQLIGSADYSLQTLSSDKNLSLSYKLALGNKFFECCAAQLPMIAGGYDLWDEFINNYNIGVTVDNDNFESIENGIVKLLSMDFSLMKKNCEKVSTKYNWENESIKIINYYKENIL